MEMLDVRPLSGDRLATATLAPTAASAGVARRLLRDRLEERIPPDVLDNLLLLVTELVSNAAAVTAALLELRIACDADGVLLVELIDTNPAMPQPKAEAENNLAEHGRGLLLVDALALAWGAVPIPTGKKTVWFTLQTAASS